MSTSQYDAFAKAYDEALETKADYPRNNLLYPAIKKLLPNLEGFTVLDAGCGSGIWTYELSNKCESIVGIDNSREFLKLAKEKRSKPNIKYIFADLENKLPFEDSEFDIVVSNLVFHYVENIAELANEIRRILKPKGYLFFSILHPIYESKKYSLDQSKYKYRGLVGSVGVEVSRYWRSMDSYIKTFETLGFKLIKLTETKITKRDEKSYPKYKGLVGVPRFAVFLFQKT